MEKVSFYFITGFASDHGKDGKHFFHLHIHGLHSDVKHIPAKELAKGIEELKTKALIEMAMTQATPKAESFSEIGRLWGSSEARLVIPLLSYEPIYQLAEYINSRKGGE